MCQLHLQFLYQRGKNCCLLTSKLLESGANCVQFRMSSVQVNNQSGRRGQLYLRGRECSLLKQHFSPQKNNQPWINTAQNGFTISTWNRFWLHLLLVSRLPSHIHLAISLVTNQVFVLFLSATFYSQVDLKKKKRIVMSDVCSTAVVCFKHVSCVKGHPAPLRTA